MTKEDRSKKMVRIASIFASLLVFVGAVLVYMYANGWRIDLFEQRVLKTGVLTVESDPFLATLTVDGDNIGRTPKSSSLNIGKYDILITRDGYFEWKKRVEIKEEKSTNVYPWLIKNPIEKENIYNIDNRTYIQSWENENKDRILILTSRIIDEVGTLEYELWLYSVNTTFWDLSQNPKVILSFQSIETPTIELLPSPEGTLWVLNYTEGEKTTTYLLDTSVVSTLQNLLVLNISEFNAYKMEWAENSQYLMFESDHHLISFNIQRQTRYLLIKKTPDTEYIWNTDEQGYFYTL
jgi:hypothetical protein